MQFTPQEPWNARSKPLLRAVDFLGIEPCSMRSNCAPAAMNGVVSLIVIPAQAGIQGRATYAQRWIPVATGMSS